ncbi:uncharacterized protein LOC114950648 [Acropora millepora]|uniref:uncharacterized protein LOC114950648 n=1 Tax=Acropora millepora TaxID=45264 RepID=UPI001CF5B1FE|nr:uncharacterized protein LOC114950648 [Acropora millepora]
MAARGSIKRGFLPGYFEGLQLKESRQRYLEKLKDVNGEDPYEVLRNEWTDDVDSWPNVTYIHVGMYLLFSKSPYTEDQLMNYKSLDCYQNFANGWVREVFVKKFGENRLLIAKVNHSQRMSEKPLTPWVVCEKSGKVLSAHCDCMAGLGESCSHVASLLWAIEAGCKRRDSLTVTEKKAYWVLPSAVKSVPYSRVKDIQFSKTPSNATSVIKESSVAAPSETELNEFFISINKCSSKPAILSLIPDYADSYVPKSLSPELPDVLSNLYDKDLANADYPTLLKKAEDIVRQLQVIKKQQALVEERTRGQANSRLWFRMRTGRITASRFKNACHTDPSCPSHSLIMGICHPEMARFNTEATKWGCQHEQVAKEAYARYQKGKHKNFNMSDSGLFISTDHPYLGASPDGLVSCECCGAGGYEIKCPFCHKDDEISMSAQDKNFCLEVTAMGAHQLKRSHQYYYQVQLQLMCTYLKYIDFVVWTKKGLFIERIFPDKMFWEHTIPKAKEFFVRGILPELIGKWYSRPVTSAKDVSPTVKGGDSKEFCYCKGGEHGQMVGCDDEECIYQWFHLECLKLKAFPKSKTWYCPDCQKRRRGRSMRTQRSE